MSDTVVLLNENAPQNPWRITLRQFQRHRLANASLILLIVFLLLAIFADRIAPFNPNDIDPRAAGVTRGFPQPPTIEHPLGTDDLNRDLSARLLYGMRVSLAVGASMVQTFSISGLPSRPCGMKISTTMRMAKAATFL